MLSIDLIDVITSKKFKIYHYFESDFLTNMVSLSHPDPFFLDALFGVLMKILKVIFTYSFEIFYELLTFPYIFFKRFPLKAGWFTLLT